MKNVKSFDKSTPLETLILLSADENGRLPFPEGSAKDVESQMKEFLSMEMKGYLHRENGGNFCRAYYLTQLGKKARDALLHAHAGGHGGEDGMAWKIPQVAGINPLNIQFSPQ